MDSGEIGESSNLDLRDGHSPGLRRSMSVITVAGCLAVVYSTCINCPAATQFFIDLGAKEFDFGLIGAIPLALLVMQFAGAWAANQVRHRRPWFIVVCALHRTLYVPLVYLPLAMSGVDRHTILMSVLLILVLNSLLSQFVVPIWYSWMADLLPSKTLNTYWGRRQGWMTLTSTVSFLVVALCFHPYVLRSLFGGASIEPMFRLVVIAGCIAGVTDILLFIRVDDVPNTPLANVRLKDSVLAPLRDRNYRSFITFSCAYNFAAMFGAAFMQLYVLKILGISVFLTTLIWTVPGMGAWFVAERWGRVADRHGHRPLIRLCLAAKPLAPLVFFVVTRGTAPFLLPIFFFFDAMANAGISVASSGYMLKMSPRENRAMFVAASAVFGSLCGAIASFAGGSVLEALSGCSTSVLGFEITNYRWVFLISALMRIATIPLAGRIREPTSARTGAILVLYQRSLPVRMLLVPLNLFRRLAKARRQSPR